MQYSGIASECWRSLTISLSVELCLFPREGSNPPADFFQWLQAGGSCRENLNVSNCIFCGKQHFLLIPGYAGRSS